ncbi:MAG: Ig-like domain-containing protein, partial [Cyanobium sp.]
PFVDDGDAAFSITGSPAVGLVLTASNTAVDPDGNGSFSYTWQSFNGSTWSSIGTDTSTYTLRSAEEGKQVRVLVSYTDSQGFAEAVTANAVSVPFVDDGDAAFSITGTPAVGQILTATNTAADPDGNGSFSYAWQSFNGSTWSAIGSDASTYTLNATEGGKQVRVQVSYTDSQGFSELVSTSAVTILKISKTATITGVSDNVGLIKGNIAPGGSTDDRTPTISGTLSTPLASGEKLGIFNGSTQLGKATVNNTAGTWSYTPTLPATAGTSYSIVARVSDAAGNQGAPSPSSGFVLDTTAPTTTATITGVADDVGWIQGNVVSGGHTDDGTPTIHGSLSGPLLSGESLLMFNGSSLLGAATVDASGTTWSYSPTLPASDGTPYTIIARVSDPLGNLGTASPSYRFRLDTTTPTASATITGVSDNVGLIKGNIAPDGSTDDRTPTISGTLSAALATGETLRIFNGSTLLGSAIVDHAARTWSLTPTLPATAGTSYSITARVADAAGNRGVSDAARTFTLDSIAPSVVSFTPIDGAIGVNPAADISLSLSEDIQRGGGAIQLRTGSAAGPILESFDATTSSRLSITGSSLTIDPISNLAPNTQYFLTFPSGSLIDRAGNPFAGTSTYDFRTTNVVSGTPANDILSFTSTVDLLTGLAGVDTFRLTSLSHSRLPASPTPPIDRITDLVTGLDVIDTPVARTLATALIPTALGVVTELSAAAIAAVLTPDNFPALSTTSSGGAATFTFEDVAKGSRTFLAINDGVSGFSAAADSILEISGYSGSLSQLQVF